MPTENRSSNTEMAAQLSPCPHCGQQDAFVEQLDSDASVVICQGRIDEYSVCLARGPVGVQQHECEDQPGHDQAVKEWNKRAAAAPHPEPIAWMVGTAFWWTKEEAERDAAATGLPIVGLGPMTGIAPAERQLGEPVCLDGATFMGEPSFQHSIEWYREGISKHWKKICDLRAEVERLRAALRFYADREHFHFASGNWDTVSGEPLNILWCGEEPDFIEDGTVARNALSASAEPSAPAVSNLPGLTDDLREILDRPNFTCHFIAKALRIMGHSIAPKSEDEQAVVIHWLLGHYLKNGSDWRVRAEAELKSASEKLAPSAAPQK
ncbi:Lar family restriction alleviation protein [Pseudomonas fulva]|uniref:Lar family restriction alleviation protein n=1 Tax=Pseudomonas fulva TaxID=47880 RepID=UPI0018AB9DB7|nr:Lar family restriction alleviation protein [Pseudomonas fulva]MBF8676174.1 Lar family restriction alleviation protein [Pseudomonas fulva]MBF8698562.1 Lar family restriction alleviation protein [Pseudomonas fulva]